MPIAYIRSLKTSLGNFHYKLVLKKNGNKIEFLVNQVEAWKTALAKFVLWIDFEQDFSVQTAPEEGEVSETIAESESTGIKYTARMYDLNQVDSSTKSLKRVEVEVSRILNLQHRNLPRFHRLYLTPHYLIVLYERVQGTLLSDMISHSKHNFKSSVLEGTESLMI